MTDIRRFFKRQRVSDEGLSSSRAEESSVTCDSVAPLDQSDADFHQRTVAEVVDSMKGTPSSGSFIVRAFTNYKKLHEACRDHVKSQWHQEAMAASQNFMDVLTGKQLPIVQQLNRSLQDQAERNRLKLFPIVSTIIFCATHDMLIRGKQSGSGVFNDLLDFRVGAGDICLQEHFASGAGNAKYTSVRVQNEIITICATS
ncbi:hypothetical protein HPB48_006915 [Haemaphysalis longicornis]|uniref:Uncharacterized protein n=1 Tax=Haemaphysalis longicornis TaxID=44386 RepID=A0A9J6FG33_HAELO|nr:hypothetical protein HPB48_006915 [Haemaphysalis longicornis]